MRGSRATPVHPYPKVPEAYRPPRGPVSPFDACSSLSLGAHRVRPKRLSERWPSCQADQGQGPQRGTHREGFEMPTPPGPPELGLYPRYLAALSLRVPVTRRSTGSRRATAAIKGDGGRMAVRDSKWADGSAFVFPSAAWAAFISDLKHAE
ncbi:DUF397 domain-containing protein [Streptomyces violascens]|uniref:DUF397 domain-containing protein n=1 Tax=Streptomyces violascens TaxID=67381 RepID=UPI00378F6F1E